MKHYEPSDMDMHPTVTAIEDDISALESQLTDPPKGDDLAQQKSEISKEIDRLKTRLYARETAQKAEDRIAELEARLKSCGIEKAVLEGDIYQIGRFIVERTKKMEGRINSMFTDVGFKLFKELINGGIEECCEAVVNGTTYDKANTGGQINAGLDIINTISKFKNIHVPVFVDQANLVTDMRQLDAQMIRLVVEKGAPINIGSY
jgi:hypothetical protein